MRLLGFAHGAAHGSLEISACGRFATPHYTVYSPLDRRQGHATRLVDAMLVEAEKRGLTVLWIDEPEYDGVGRFSNDGQAFADAYRLKRGIPLPEFTNVFYNRQPRQQAA